MAIVETQTSDIPGVWVSKTRDQLLLSGPNAAKGGPGNAWAAGELLLSALNSCAAALMLSAAADKGIPLARVHVASESEKDTAQPDRYARLHVDFTLTGVSQADADTLLTYFKDNCPIYGSLSRGAPVTVKLHIN